MKLEQYSVHNDRPLARLRPNSTYVNKDDILELLRTGGITNVILGSKFQNNNGHALVMVLSAQTSEVVFDNGMMSIARDPRESEVRFILEILVNLHIPTWYIPVRLADMKYDATEEAYQKIISHDKLPITGRNDVDAFYESLQHNFSEYYEDELENSFGPRSDFQSM